MGHAVPFADEARAGREGPGPAWGWCRFGRSLAGRRPGAQLSSDHRLQPAERLHLHPIGSAVFQQSAAQALGRRPAMCRLLQLRHGGALLPLEQLQDSVCLGGFGSHVYASMIPRPLHAGAVTAQSPGGVAPSTGRAVLEVFRSLRAPYRAVTLPLSSQRKSNGEIDRPAPKPARTRLPPASQSPPTTGTASPGASASTSPPRERQSDATPSSSGRGRSRSYGTGKVVLIVIRSAVLVVGSAPTIRL